MIIPNTLTVIQFMHSNGERGRFLTSRRKVRYEEMFTVPTKNKTVGNLSEKKVGLLGKGDRLYENVE